MKTWLVAFPLIFAAFHASAAANPDPAEYMLDVTVDTSKVSIRCGQVLSVGGNAGNSCSWYQNLTVYIGTEQYELMGLHAKKGPYLLKRGTYKGKVVKREAPSSYEDSTKYQLLLPDGATADFQLVQE